MSEFDFDASDFFNHLDVKERKVLNAQKGTMQDAVDDLERISTGIAPIKLSPLRKSAHSDVTVEPGGVVGEVAFSAAETSKKGRFNYALWTHEQDYKLGPQSQAAGGTDGYSVGNKYLERPLKGEAEKYVKWWADSTAKELD